jgi:DNA-binding GntR family transcriptional regulator
MLGVRGDPLPRDAVGGDDPASFPPRSAPGVAGDAGVGAGATLPRLDKAELHERIYDLVRERILDGTFAPGTWLSIGRLAEQLGVSRSPVHIALTRLVRAGLLIAVPRRGTLVPPYDTAMYLAVLEVRAGLEAQAGELALERMDEADVAPAWATFAEMRRAFPTEEALAARPAAYLRLNRRLHEQLVAAAHNEVLLDLYRQVLDRMFQLRAGGAPQAVAIRARRSGIEALHREHQQILDAYRARDRRALLAAIKSQAARLTAAAGSPVAEPAPHRRQEP